MIKVLFEDKFIIVCEKPVNILSEYQTNTRRTMPDILKKMTGAYSIDTVHRLDKMVGGTMVYSKSRRATAALSRAVRDHKVLKEYLAVVHGEPTEKSGEMCDILFKDSQKNKSFVIKTMRKGAKDARLEYSTVAVKTHDCKPLSLVKIRLHTGRTHQIRVQFSSRKMPLLFDTKYGSPEKGGNIALWSHHLRFSHPVKHGTVDEYSLPNTSQFPWSLFKNEITTLPKQKADDALSSDFKNRDDREKSTDSK